MKKRTITMHERIAVIAVLLVLWSCGIGARLVHLQVYNQRWLADRALRQQERTVEVSATRGRLLDRNGRELARSVEAKSVYATLAEIEDKPGAARRLSKVLDVAEKALLERLTSDRQFVLLKRKVEPEMAAEVEKLGLEGIELVGEMKRIYPKGSLAAHVLGYCGVDENGLAGLEFVLDEQMRGRDGRVVLTTDARQKSYDAAEIAPIPGNDVHLTIDEIAQYRVEQALAEGVRKSGANWGIAIVMRPQTGEILALANYPTFDLNAFGAASDDVRRNRAVEAVFEPGSVFKIVPFSGCLEDGLISPETMIDCQYGSINVNGRTVHDTPYGTLKASDALAFSSNVAAIKMGMKLGNERFYDYIRSYGFGARTGIELPGESPGIVNPVSSWTPTTIGSIPMGHEVSVTALQEVAAMAALANGGEWVQPHVVRRVVSPEGEAVSETKAERRRVVSPQTAAAMAGMLEDVVLKGTAKHAKLEGLRAAGKTGTAQKIDPRTKRYSHTKYVASFCGFAPAENPELACIVVLDEPHVGGRTGGVTAAPIFGRILEDLFGDYAIPLSAPEPTRAEIASLRAEQASRPAERERLELATPPAPAPDARVPEIEMIETSAAGSGIVVPDLNGRGLRAAMRIGLESGLVVQASGSGLVKKQSPRPGSVVAPGTVLMVELSR
jgi:cell division protein FtsI/penicillin-binding protein 2